MMINVMLWTQLPGQPQQALHGPKKFTHLRTPNGVKTEAFLISNMFNENESWGSVVLMADFAKAR